MSEPALLAAMPSWTTPQLRQAIRVGSSSTVMSAYLAELARREDGDRATFRFRVALAVAGLTLAAAIVAAVAAVVGVLKP